MGQYQGYERYKDSGVEWLGEIPEHWEKLKIKRLTQIKRGASPRPIDDPEYFDDDGEYAWVRIADVTASERYLESTTQKLSALGKSFSVPLESGELFLSIAGSVGKPIITKIKCCIHDGFVYFPGLKINQEFIYYIFSSGQPYLGLGKLGTQLNLNTETVGGIYIGLPPLEEQDAIAQFLDHKTSQIDALIAKKEALLQKLDEKRTALISHAVTKGLDPTVPMKDSGIEWLGNIPAHWDKSLVNRYFKVELGKMLDRSKNIKNGVLKPYLRAANIHWNLLLINDLNEMEFSPDQLSRYRLREGDLLVTEGGVTVGRSAIWNNEVDECYYQNSINRVRSREEDLALTSYLYFWMYFMKTNGYIELSANIATFGHLTQEKLKALPVLIPPVDEQQTIIDFLNRSEQEINQQKAKIQQALDLLKEYRTALITNAVTGKIDIRQALQ